MTKTIATALFSILTAQSAFALQCTGDLSVIFAGQTAPTPGVVDVQTDQVTVRAPEALGDLVFTFLKNGSELTLSQPSDLSGQGTLILSGPKAILNAHLDVGDQDLQLLGSDLQCQ